MRRMEDEIWLRQGDAIRAAASLTTLQKSVGVMVEARISAWAYIPHIIQLILFQRLEDCRNYPEAHLEFQGFFDLAFGFGIGSRLVFLAVVELAQKLEILEIVRPALGHGQDMINRHPRIAADAAVFTSIPGGNLVEQDVLESLEVLALLLQGVLGEFVTVEVIETPGAFSHLDLKIYFGYLEMGRQTGIRDPEIIDITEIFPAEFHHIDAWPSVVLYAIFDPGFGFLEIDKCLLLQNDVLVILDDG